MKPQASDVIQRTDVVPLENPKLSSAIQQCLKKTAAEKTTSARLVKPEESTSAED